MNKTAHDKFNTPTHHFLDATYHFFISVTPITTQKKLWLPLLEIKIEMQKFSGDHLITTKSFLGFI